MYRVVFAVSVLLTVWAGYFFYRANPAIWRYNTIFIVGFMLIVVGIFVVLEVYRALQESNKSAAQIMRSAPPVPDFGQLRELIEALTNLVKALSSLPGASGLVLVLFGAVLMIFSLRQ